MFEKATRLKLRFNTSKGLLSVEDLWDLPLTSTTGKATLDDVAKDLHRQLKDNEEVSFVTQPTAKNEVLQLGFDIVKHVIKVRLDEKAERDTLAANREKKQKLMLLIEQKKDAALSEMSIDELSKMVAAL